MKVFNHHIYEYQKGLRNLILHTVKKELQPEIEKKLSRLKISYVIHTITANKINIYFGNPLCVAIIKKINKPLLNNLTHEEDFILGTMLGYGLLPQCSRYLKRSRDKKLVDTVIG